MRRAMKGLILGGLIAVLAASTTMAGAKVKIGDDSEIDLGIRIQALYISTDSDLNGDGVFDSFDDFKLRRGRIRLKATIGEHFDAFLQTEVGSGAGGTGLDARLIDGFVTVKKDNWVQFIAGVNMAPASRQNLTSSGALMAIDRPGIVYKSSTWGGRALSTFANTTYGASNSGLSGEVAVRDTGLTFFGSGDINDKTHIKYYLGMYDGIQRPGEDSERLTGRVQLNWFDAEPGYYNSSTYLGKKKTVGVGLSFDQQSDVAMDTMAMPVDYQYNSLDVFTEWPVGEGKSFTGELGYSKLDFDDQPGFTNSQGDGYYLQLGYYVNKWQPWIEYETWSSDAVADLGSLDQFRLGVTRYVHGQNANIKLGFEKFNTDVPITGTEDSITSVVLGFYTTY